MYYLTFIFEHFCSLLSLVDNRTKFEHRENLFNQKTAFVLVV